MRCAAAIELGTTKVLWVETPSNPLMKITRHRGARRARPRGRRARGRRQHLRLARAAAAARARRRRRRALDHEVPRRALRRASAAALVLAAGQRGARRAGRVHPVRGGRGLGPVRRVPHRRAASRRSASGCSGTARTRRRSRERLEGHAGIEHVYYPGLESHPGHELAARQMSGFGGMISIALAGGAEAARRFAESTTLFQLAESLGGVESLVNYPSEMTHASVRGTEARGARVRRAPLGRHRGRRRPARRHRRGARAAVAAVGRGRRRSYRDHLQVSIRRCAPTRPTAVGEWWEACGSSPAPRR